MEDKIFCVEIEKNRYEIVACVIPVSACNWNSGTGFQLGTAFAKKASKNTFAMSTSTGLTYVVQALKNGEMLNPLSNGYLGRQRREVIQSLPEVIVPFDMFSHGGSVYDALPAMAAATSGQTVLAADWDEQVDALSLGASAWYLLDHPDLNAFHQNPGTWVAKRSVYILDRIEQIKNNLHGKH